MNVNDDYNNDLYCLRVYSGFEINENNVYKNSISEFELDRDEISDNKEWNFDKFISVFDKNKEKLKYLNIKEINSINKKIENLSEKQMKKEKNKYNFLQKFFKRLGNFLIFRGFMTKGERGLSLAKKSKEELAYSVFLIFYKSCHNLENDIKSMDFEYINSLEDEEFNIVANGGHSYFYDCNGNARVSPKKEFFNSLSDEKKNFLIKGVLRDWFWFNITCNMYIRDLEDNIEIDFLQEEMYTKYASFYKNLCNREERCRMPSNEKCMKQLHARLFVGYINTETDKSQKDTFIKNYLLLYPPMHQKKTFKYIMRSPFLEEGAKNYLMKNELLEEHLNISKYA